MANHGCLNAICSKLLQTFQQQLKQCWKTKKSDKENIEECFFLCNEYWNKIRRLVSYHFFEKAEDEIYFFRHIKPAFCCEIEYYALLYQSDMFLPDVEPQILPYWHREKGRLKQF